MTDRLRPAVVIYAALSKGSDDPEKESIESQVAKVRQRVAELYPDGVDVIGPPGGQRDYFEDDGYSGSKRNRGPGLQSAIDTASRVADERGACELWANTSARFGRGTSKRNEARAIGALFYELRPLGVALRSVHDDHLVSMEELVGIGSRIAAKYSEDLSESIKRAKVRQLQRGDHLGGPVCDGYLIASVHDDSGKVIGREFALDPAREPVVRSIFDLAGEGMPDAMIARRLNSRGTRTRHGRPFTRRAIQNTVTNPWYAGRVAYKRGTPDEQIVDGKHPPLVDPAKFDRIQRMRAARDHAEPSQKVIGRPAQNHALARLAVCGRCGERLYAVTSTYRRKDGSRARSYVCHSYKFATGTCDAKPISADFVDAAVIAGLDTLLVDFEAWRARIETGHADERERLAREVERAQRDYDVQAAKVAKVERKWAEYVAAGDDDKADLVLPIVEHERQARTEAQRRLQATQDALASVPAAAPAAAMLDFANALRAAIGGRVDKTGTIGEINQALREMFVCFRITETDGSGPYDGILIEPWLRLDAVAPPSDPELGWAWPALVKPDDEPPPLRWPSPNPEGNLHNPHEPWHYGYTLNPRSTPRPAAGDGDQQRSAVPAFVPARFAPMLARAAQRWNVSAALLAAQLYAESNFNPFAQSPAGAQGIAQFMPGTAQAIGLENPFAPGPAIDAQAHLMRDLLRRFATVPLALAAYNAGPGAVAGCMCIPPYEETRGYVARILALLGGAGEVVPGAGLTVRLVR